MKEVIIIPSGEPDKVKKFIDNVSKQLAIHGIEYEISIDNDGTEHNRKGNHNLLIEFSGKEDKVELLVESLERRFSNELSLSISTRSTKRLK